MSLPREPRSWNMQHGGCGALLNSDSECDRRAGHYDEEPGDGQSFHRAHDPSGSGQWVEYTDDGVIVDEWKRPLLPRVDVDGVEVPSGAISPETRERITRPAIGRVQSVGRNSARPLRRP